MAEDVWKMFDNSMRCGTCMYGVPKEGNLGRCRRNAPTIKGYPVVNMSNDFCGDHKLGTNPYTLVRTAITQLGGAPGPMTSPPVHNRPVKRNR